MANVPAAAVCGLKDRALVFLTNGSKGCCCCLCRFDFEKNLLLFFYELRRLFLTEMEKKKIHHTFYTWAD